jgi:hypothetical protein
MSKSWCDSHISQRCLCVPTCKPPAEISNTTAVLGSSPFTHEKPQPGGDVWIVDVDPERLTRS